MEENGKKFIYWFAGDVCGNVVSSDNLPATGKLYVTDELKDEGANIKHKLTYNGHTRNIVVPKRGGDGPVYIRALHNAVHKFLEDGKRVSVKFVEAGKHQFCTRKQYEKFIAKK
jgi:hypothetical protein